MSAPTPGQGPKKIEPSQEGFVQFLLHNKLDAVAYLVLFCGLLLSLFHLFFGGIIVGIILGLYFSKEMQTRLMQFKDFLAHEGVFHGFVVIAAMIALFIASPGLIIGTFCGAFIRPYLGNSLKG